jgi:hypothetical protein
MSIRSRLIRRPIFDRPAATAPARAIDIVNSWRTVVKYLCLAYGAEADWKVLDEKEQTGLLAQDEVIRKRGALMAAVEPTVTTVRAWEGKAVVVEGSIAHLDAPLAGFSVIEAADINEVIRLVANTPCARAKGASVIRPIMFINDQEWAVPRV